MDSHTPKKKVYIIEEQEYEVLEMVPPNFRPWFAWAENWDKLSDLTDIP